MTNVHPRKKIMYAKRFFTHTHTHAACGSSEHGSLVYFQKSLDVLLPCPILDNFCAEVLSEAPVDHRHPAPGAIVGIDHGTKGEFKRRLSWIKIK